MVCRSDSCRHAVAAFQPICWACWEYVFGQQDRPVESKPQRLEVCLSSTYHRSWPGALWVKRKNNTSWAREVYVARDFPCPWNLCPTSSAVTHTLCSHGHVIHSFLILSRRSCIPSSEGILKACYLVQHLVHYNPKITSQLKFLLSNFYRSWCGEWT